MPEQKKPSFLAKKAGQIGKAHAASKDKPPEVGQGSRLPPGIDGGVARLSNLVIGQYKDGKHKGEPFFMGTGVVVEPETFNGRRIKGNQTRVGPIPLCDTPERKKKKTFDENYDEFLDHLKLLCGPDNTIGKETERQPGESDDGYGQRVNLYLDALMAELKKQKPHFGFRTWIGDATQEYPNPRTNEVWEGFIEYTPSENGDTSAAPDAQDDSGADDHMDPPPGNDAVDVDQSVDDTTVEIGDAPTEPTPEELDALVEDADDSNKKNKKRVPAQAELERLGLAAGISQEDIDGADSFRDVADLILATQGGGDDSRGGDDTATAADEPPPEYVPEKGKVEEYRLRDKTGKVVVGKDKKPVKPTQCDVVFVNPKTKTVTLKDLNTDKVILGSDKKPLQVPWADLEPSS